MRYPLRLLRWGLLSLAGLVVLAALAGGALLGLTLPDCGGLARLAGLSAPVAVTFDSEGVPHIRAANPQDAAEALGWLHARDRLAQMDLMRRAASGTLSELAGPATLPMDRMMRTLGLRRRAARDLAALDGPTRAMLEAYARGVNGWIARKGRFAALEFLLTGPPAPWQPVDSLLWGRTLGVWLSGNWRAELARLALSGRLPAATIAALWPPAGGPGRPQAAHTDPELSAAAIRLAALLPAFPAPFAQPATASDEWALDGRHTATGAPLLAGDPHLALGLPGLWYLARIDTPQGVLAGATAPGAPFLMFGHNGHIAWSFTTTGADTQDLFVETPAGPDAYLTPDGPRPYTLWEEHIRVRGAPDEVLRVRETRHGPVISDLLAASPVVLALAAASLEPGEAAPGLFALNRAASVAEAGAAAAQILAPVQNLLVADRTTIGLFVTGRVPMRRAGDGRAPVDGASGAFDWTGFAAGPALPHVVAPASGRLVNANEPVAAPDFPVDLGRDTYDDTRARRIRQLLEGMGPATPASFATMQLDTRDLLATDLRPRLLATPAEGPAARALALLAEWDGTAAPDAPQPLIFTAWMQRLRAAMLATAGVPPSAEAATAPWPGLIPATLAAPASPLCGGDCTPLLARTLRETVADLAARYGADPAAWRWGEAHPAVFAHPLARVLPGPFRRLLEARIPAPGDDVTLLRAAMAPDAFATGRFPAVHGAAYRGVYDLADLDRSLFLVAPGQSGHPASVLARNFVRRWAEGGMIRLPATPAAPTGRWDLLPGDPR